MRCLSVWKKTMSLPELAFSLVFFSLLGKQKDMPISMAVPAVSTLGYLGILMGPAAIGFLAHQTSLYAAFGLLAFLVALQALIAAYVYNLFWFNF